jgi:hypothetical protein
MLRARGLSGYIKSTEVGLRFMHQLLNNLSGPLSFHCLIGLLNVRG